MCMAEEDLQAAERRLVWFSEKLDELVDLIEDCERGILAPAELRRDAQAFRGLPA